MNADSTMFVDLARLKRPQARSNRYLNGRIPMPGQRRKVYGRIASNTSAAALAYLGERFGKRWHNLVQSERIEDPAVVRNYLDLPPAGLKE